MLRKQHEGTGQSSSSKNQEDYAKIFEMVLSEGEIFDRVLPPSYSASSRNPGIKKKKGRETDRNKEERDTISEEETWISLFLSLCLTSRNSSLNVC